MISEESGGSSSGDWSIVEAVLRVSSFLFWVDLKILALFVLVLPTSNHIFVYGAAV